MHRRSGLLAFITVSFVVSAGAHQARADGPERIPNTVPYRVSKPSAATGRSGTATLTTRALLRRTGETDIELTTGELDGPAGSAPGAIARAQIATLDGRGHRQVVKEYQNAEAPGPYVAITYTGLPRGQALNIQANVIDIDGARTDIVSAMPRVKLRPDLAVERVAAPAQVLTRTPTVITATIAERNQDVGARANCVLSVDGTDVDRAEGIWVDAAGTVSCAFTHTFNSSGSKVVGVRVSDVMPPDYDSANNVAATSISARDEEPFDFYSVDTLSVETRRGGRYQSWSTRSEGLTTYGQDFESQEVLQETSQAVSYYARIHGAVTLPITAVTATESTDGTLLSSATLDSIDVSGCVTRYAGTEHVVFFYICTGLGTPESNLGMILMYQRAAGEVTFFSRGYDVSWHQGPDGTVVTDASYSWNYSDRLVLTNPPAAWGSTYTVEVSLMSGDAMYTGPLTMTLQRVSTGYSFDWQCSEFVGDFGWRRICQDYVDMSVTTSGYAGWQR